MMMMIIKVDEHKHVTIMLQGKNEDKRETNKSSSTLVASPTILEPSTDEQSTVTLQFYGINFPSPWYQHSVTYL